MAYYINGIGAISPQKTFGDVPFLETVKSVEGNRFVSIEPDYQGWIDPKAIRRMSRVIRMGVASAAYALKEAGLQKPDAILTGTAFGCLDDTGIFLSKMIENNENALNPTPFIQSTHNTIGSQVALLLQCQGYNQTYSHRGFSFEHAMKDGMMLLDEHPGSVLVGGVDEATDHSYNIMNRFGMYRDANGAGTKGIVQGEGGTYMVLSTERSGSSYARVVDVTTGYKIPNERAIEQKVDQFLSRHSLQNGDIDLLLLGYNGDEQDEKYSLLTDTLFPTIPVGRFKHLCGEYQTSNAFAVWAAANILKRRQVPICMVGKRIETPKRILIYNHYRGSHHSLILLEAC